MRKAIIIYGPPGSGKGTQAELLAKRFSFIHFDTGRYIESLVHSPEMKKNVIVQRERKFFDTGKLCTPSWVLKTVKEATRKVAKSGYGIVFSGSPRTLFEAFGDQNQEGLLAELKGLFGKNNIFVVQLGVKDQSSMIRNSHRLICSVCGLPVMRVHKNEHCSFCGGAFRRRTLDKPEIIKVRLKEYRERTYPIIQNMRKRGVRVFEVNGEPVPYKVNHELIKKLKLK
ncbi:MAG: nucleoside monophosphate kinase [Patescibacteria group bacterium]